MTAPVTWYFDIVSPYAWLALQRLPEIARLRPVLFRPVVFGAVLKHWGQLGPAEITPKRIHTYRHVAFLAQRLDVPFRFPQAHPFRSLDILRLIVALGETEQATLAAFSAVWAEGADANDTDVLEGIAAACGDAGALGRRNTPETKAKLVENTAEAIGYGVFGVPTLRIDGELFWGLDALDMALAYLADSTLFVRGELARAGALDVGVVRSR